MQTIFCQVPTASSPFVNGTTTDGPIIAAFTWLCPFVSAFRSLCSHRLGLGCDAFEHSVEVGVAARLVLDRGHAARRVGDEDGADAVAEAGVVDRLLRVQGDVEDLAVTLGVHGELLVARLHAASSGGGRKPPLYGSGREVEHFGAAA